MCLDDLHQGGKEGASDKQKSLRRVGQANENCNHFHDLALDVSTEQFVSLLFAVPYVPKPTAS